MNAEHGAIARALRWWPARTALALLPLLACGQTLAAPETPQADSPGGWREHVAPLSDPLDTEPAQLWQDLSLPLPPDLQPHTSDAPQPSDPAAFMPAQPPCANRATASSTHHPRQALAMLQAGQVGPAQPDQAPLLDLPTAIDLALCHNPQVRASWSAVAQQAALLGQARSAYWPQLAAGAGRQGSRTGYAGSAGGESLWTTRQHVMLSWRLWDFGARGARTDAAQAQLQAALYMQGATARQALADVLQAYGQAQAAQTGLATQRSLRPLAERSMLTARRRRAGGAGSRNDVLQATAALARIDLELSRAQGELDKAQAQLAYLVGLPPGTAYRIQTVEPANATAAAAPTVTTDGAPYRLLNRTLDDWLAQAQENHPAIQAARAQWQAAQANLEAVQSEGLPTIDLNLGHYRNGRPDTAATAGPARENVIGVSLNIPLFDGFSHTYKVRAAQAQVEQKAVELQATEQQTLQDIVQLHAQARAALGNLQAANNLYAISTEAAQSAQRQYELGAADIVQLNQSLANLQQAQADLTRSHTDWNKARLSLWLQETALESLPHP